MSLHDLAESIRHLWLFTAVRESTIVYPCVLSTHLTCIGVFGGLIAITDMRLLGLALTRYSIASVVRQLRPWKWFGLITMVTMGVLLAGSKMNIYYDNPYFIMKIAILLLLIPAHSLIFRSSVYRDETVPAEGEPKSTGMAKLAAATSVILWVSIVVCGRWIAYYDRPDEEKVLPDGARLVVPAAPNSHPAPISGTYVAKLSVSDIRAHR